MIPDEDDWNFGRHGELCHLRDFPAAAGRFSGGKGVGPAILYGEHEERLVREMSKSVEHLAAAGADRILLGCTELPLLVENDGLERELVDPIAYAIQYLRKDCGT